MKTHDKIYQSNEIGPRYQTFKSNHLLVQELNKRFK